MSDDNITEHAPPPASPTSAGSSTRTSFQSHGRTLSMVAENAPLRHNRLSLQFPVQQSGMQSPVRRSCSPIREPARVSPVTSDIMNDPLDGNYLHLIAAQERRVLEFREQLQCAEADLNKLKVEWAKHEAHKKRNEAKRLTRLQPVHSSLPAVDREEDSDGSSAWMQQEMERRKALLSSSRASNRTVLPGQRHTRTLSLLSPTRDVFNGTVSTVAAQRPPRKDSLRSPAMQSMDEEALQGPHTQLARAFTMPTASDGQEQLLDQESLLRASKKVATDLKDNLWTFWEDLRQAAVGEESATIYPPPRRKSSAQTLKTTKKQGSKNSLRDSSRSSSAHGKTSTDRKAPSPGRNKSSGPLPDLADPSFWTDHGVASLQPVAKSVTKLTPAADNTKPMEHSHRQSTVSNDGWDTWDDSPVQSRSSSSVASETNTLPSTVSGSPRTSTSTNRESKDLSKRDSIPWPVLKKSGLRTLRRTASHLLTEWEKSLTPSPSHEYTGDDYMGASAEAAAYGAGKGKND